MALEAFVLPHSPGATRAPEKPQALWAKASAKAATPPTDGIRSSPLPLASTAAFAAVTFAGARRLKQSRTLGVQTASSTFVALPQETFNEWAQRAEDLQGQSWSKTLYASYVAGCYVGMAALLCLTLGGNMSPDPTTEKLIYAALFPVNLLLVLQTGAQLCTGNAGIMAVGAFEGRVTLRGLLRNWGLTYAGNLLGCLTMAAVAQYTGLLTGGTARMAIQGVMSKCTASFGQAFVSGVMCNWLLCAAIWLGTMARGLSGKMVGIWFPISMLVGIGFEHAVTNMFMLPAGLMAGAPASWTGMFLTNLLPVTLGNAAAGVLIVGAGMSYAFGRLGLAAAKLKTRKREVSLTAASAGA